MVATDLWPVKLGLGVASGDRKRDTGVPFRIGVLPLEPGLVEPHQLGWALDQAAGGSQPSAGARPR